MNDIILKTKMYFAVEDFQFFVEYHNSLTEEELAVSTIDFKELGILWGENMSILKAKVVGLSFHRINTPVELEDYLIIREDSNNEFDSDAISILNKDQELVGNVANSSKTLSINNIKNGNLSATQLKSKLNFKNREYYGKAVRVYSSCIYIEINSENWSYLNKPVDDVPEPAFKKAIEIIETDATPIDDVESLKEEIQHLKSIVSELHGIVVDLKSIVTGGK